jgi:hypothetical protein
VNGHVETRTRHPRAVIPKAAEERRHRADSALTAVASRRTGVRAKAAIQLRAEMGFTAFLRHSPHRPPAIRR